MQNKSKKIKQQKQPTKYSQLLDMFKNASNDDKIGFVCGIIKTSFEKKITSYESLGLLKFLFTETTIKKDTCGQKRVLTHG